MVFEVYLFLYKCYSLLLCLQKTFSFAVRDSLVNIGPLKDFSYGLRMNADASATGISKQSNYELVSFFMCSHQFLGFAYSKERNIE